MTTASPTVSPPSGTPASSGAAPATATGSAAPTPRAEMDAAVEVLKAHGDEWAALDAWP